MSEALVPPGSIVETKTGHLVETGTDFGGHERDSKPLAGPNILLMGPGGTGKTHALGTLVDWAQANKREVFVLFTEAGLETLKGYWTDRGEEIPACLRWHQTMTQPVSLKALTDAADSIGKLSYEGITKMVDPDRSKNNAFFKILKACADFPDDRTGQKFGPIDAFGVEKIFVNDGLSETANAVMKMVIGSKPTASQPDYGVAQNNLMNWLRLCTQGMTCTFVMTAHVDRETDEVTQTTKIMVKAIGKALATAIPPLFSDVIYTVREGDKFYWDTAAYGVDTKTRSLGYRSKIDPSFAQIMDLWVKRGGGK